MIYITRKEHFSASHKLHNNSLSESENNEIFGKCNNYHGHNYYLEVTLCGKINPKTGYLMDLKKLKDILAEEILNIVDHKHLNDLDIFKSVIPTTENMAVIFWNILKNKIETDKVSLHSLKIYETDKNFVEYKG